MSTPLASCDEKVFELLKAMGLDDQHIVSMTIVFRSKKLVTIELLKEMQADELGPLQKWVEQFVLTPKERNPADAIAWRWSENGGKAWFGWTTDFSGHDKAIKLDCLIEYAYPEKS